MSDKTPETLLEDNARWAAARLAANPESFSALAPSQSPEFLWIGCSDSRVPVSAVTGTEPGEVFVHRNIANVVYAADISCMSVIQFAVEHLGVKHIIVCGHTNCGGVKAVLDGYRDGMVGHWLEPIRQIARQHHETLQALPDDSARLAHLCELNVQGQVASLATTPVIQNAWQSGQQLTLHGWIYDLNTGRLTDLDCSRSGE